MSRAKRQGVMLAKPYDEKVVRSWKNSYYLQPKLNGVRAWVDWGIGGTPALISSYGSEFNLPHITKELKGSFRMRKWDGELYTHGMAFEDIHSICSTRKSVHPDSEKIQFHIYDVKMNEPYVTRMGLLPAVSFGPIKTVPKNLVYPGTNITSLVEWYVDLGYEGVILRRADGMYVEKKTNDLLKFKPKKSDFYLIKSVEEGKGWAKGMLGAFWVDDGCTTWKVGTGKLLTKEKRAALWEMRDELPGQFLKVEHELITTNTGKPKCATALDISQTSEELRDNPFIEVL